MLLDRNSFLWYVIVLNTNCLRTEFISFCIIRNVSVVCVVVWILSKGANEMNLGDVNTDKIVRSSLREIVLIFHRTICYLTWFRIFRRNRVSFSVRQYNLINFKFNCFVIGHVCRCPTITHHTFRKPPLRWQTCMFVQWFTPK